jgi:hypothetical protein
VYWYSYQVRNFEYNLSVIGTSHFLTLATPDTPHVPKTFWKAMAIPEWKLSIDTELKKFEANACLEFVPYTGQHLVPMMWLFNIKNDGTCKARLVGRGDLMIPLVDFDPIAVYCGIVSACSIKICITITAMYRLVMRGGDLVGAYRTPEMIASCSEATPVHGTWKPCNPLCNYTSSAMPTSAATATMTTARQATWATSPTTLSAGAPPTKAVYPRPQLNRKLRL